MGETPQLAVHERTEARQQRPRRPQRLAFTALGNFEFPGANELHSERRALVSAPTDAHLVMRYSLLRAGESVPNAAQPVPALHRYKSAASFIIQFFRKYFTHELK